MMANLSISDPDQGTRPSDFCPSDFPVWPDILAGVDTSSWSFWSFQVPNLLLLLAFLVPFWPSPTKCSLVFLRTFAALACGLLAAWSWLSCRRADWIIWNGVSAVANLLHLFVLLWQMRPVKFNKDLELVYRSMFAPLRVSRRQFKKVTSALAGGTQFVPANTAFVEEGKTHVENLTLVLDGSFAVTQGARKLHIVRALQFLDSPEWFLVATDHAFQVTMTTLEDSMVVTWHRDRLKLCIMRDQFLQAVFDHILGRDVVRKLLQVSDTMSTATMLRCEKRSTSSPDRDSLHSNSLGSIGRKNNSHGSGDAALRLYSSTLLNQSRQPLVVFQREKEATPQTETQKLPACEEEPLLGMVWLPNNKRDRLAGGGCGQGTGLAFEHGLAEIRTTSL